MDQEDAIWNRALGFGGDKGTGEGDLALENLLKLHGLAMSGGLLSALEMLSNAEVDAAIDGYRWMDLGYAADSVRMVRGEISSGALDDDVRAEALELDADQAYYAAVPKDDTLQAAFRAKLAERPGSFDEI
jgi:hypothetical protein